MTLGFSAQILCYSLAVMSSWAQCLCDTDLSMYWSVMTMKTEKSNILKWFYGPIIYVTKKCLVVKYAHSDLVWRFSKCVSPCKLTQPCLRIHSPTPFIDTSFSFHFMGVWCLLKLKNFHYEHPFPCLSCNNNNDFYLTLILQCSFPSSFQNWDFIQKYTLTKVSVQQILRIQMNLCLILKAADF